jgi:hypothetical protein
VKVRYRETGKSDHVEFDEGNEGLVLVGFGNPCHLDPIAPYFVGPATFGDDWELLSATDDERRRLQDAGFRID